MRSAALVVAFTAAVVGAASCLVDRRSGEFTCTSDADCADFSDNRFCDTDQGFCIPEDCPSACNGGCDLQAKTCQIDCLTPNKCRDGVDCPDDFTCDIKCNATNACGRVDCSNARSCKISCSGTNACDDIDCNGAGDPSCTVSCNGTNACADVTCDDAACSVSCANSGACGDIDCASSCNCTATCAANGACGTVSCPTGCVAGGGCGGCNTCGT